MAWPKGKHRTPTAVNIEADLARECKADPRYIYKFLAELKFDFSDLEQTLDYFISKVEEVLPPDSERRIPKKKDLELGEKTFPIVESDD